jgi:AraC-like DNA-binding protein
LKQIQKMHKDTSKLQLSSVGDKYNTDAVHQVSENFKISTNYVWQSLRGKAHSELAKKICAQYNELVLSGNAKRRLTTNRIYYNSLVVAKVAENLNVSEQYVRRALKGNAHSETADKIKDEYQRLILEVDKALNDKR